MRYAGLSSPNAHTSDACENSSREPSALWPVFCRSKGGCRSETPLNYDKNMTHHGTLQAKEGFESLNVCDIDLDVRHRCGGLDNALSSLYSAHGAAIFSRYEPKH